MCGHRLESPLLAGGWPWGALCSPRMAATSASGTLMPLAGLRGLIEGDSGENRRSFFVLAAWRGETGESLGFRLRDCRAGTAGLRLRWCRCCRLLERVLGLGLRELEASRTRVLSSSELASELSERDVHGGAGGEQTGNWTWRRTSGAERRKKVGERKDKRKGAEKSAGETWIKFVWASTAQYINLNFLWNLFCLIYENTIQIHMILISQL